MVFYTRIALLALALFVFSTNGAFAHNGIIHATEEEAAQHEQETAAQAAEQNLDAGEGFGAIADKIQNQDPKSSPSGIQSLEGLQGSELVPLREPTEEELANLQVPIHFFGRDDCKFCKAEKEFWDNLAKERDDFRVIWYDVVKDEQAKIMFHNVTKRAEIPKVTPVTVIGYHTYQGFDTPETSGKQFVEAIDYIFDGYTNHFHIFNDIELTFLAPEFGIVDKMGEGCDEDGTECSATGPAPGTYLTLPFLGPTNVETFSLFTLSSVLGFIDGFNPCAMWVLLTFLLILLQIGDRKKMFYVAGIFILAEGIMYNLILNVWYQTWDFVQLDAIVTPLVGLVAIGGGAFFLWRYYKERSALTCDTTDLETQGKITKKIQGIAVGPMGIAAVLGIIGIAFSVNIIEFACSIGIPQAFTKILEMNDLNFIMRQFYIAIYTLFYMIDDLIVFGFALYGFDKLHQSGGKYIRLSLLIGGIMMVILGALLLFNPEALVF